MTKSRATAIRNRRQRKTGGVSTAIAAAILVGVVAAGAAVLFNMQSRDARIRAENQRRLAELEQDAQHAKADLERRTTEVSQAARSLQLEQAQTERDIRRLTAEIADIENELADLRQANARRGRRLEELELDASLVGEGLDELKERARRLLEARRRRIARFQDRYIELKEDLRQRVADKDPDRIRSFYFAHAQTPFGPAAAFFAGDRYYARRQTRRAVDMYERVVDGYPDSYYADIATERIADIRHRREYNPYVSVRFRPHNVPDVLDFGDW